MPVYPGRKRGTWRVVVWAKNRSHEWRVAGTKKQAQEFEAERRIVLRAGGKVPERTVPTLSDFCVNRYKHHARAHLKESTWRVRQFQIANIIEQLGSLRLTEIGAEELESYKQRRLAEVKASTVNNEMRVLGTILNWARALGVPVADAKTKRLPERGSGRVKVWTTVQVEALYGAAQARAPWLVPMLVFLVNTGCRSGEALAAEWDWIDFEAGMVRIPSNEAWQPKNGLPREVPMADAVRAVLSGPRKDRRWVFARHRVGGRYRNFPKETWGALVSDAGLVGGPHTLRHTFASHFLQQQPDLFLLAQVMGHSHTRVTELYAHLLPSHLSRARNAVNLLPTMATTMAGPDRKTTKRAKNKR